MADQSLRPKKVFIYYFLLFLVACLAMLPVALMWHPLKYDLIDQAYPWKYFIGECLQEGILPLWNPYQLLGSPIHADPQSSAWYPVTWFFGYLFGYDIYIISVDFILHIFLAGMGMFYLGRKLKFSPETAFFMAVSYMLSGFFTGNAQHFMWIISGTWIPFIIGAYLALKEKPSLENAIRFGLSGFMILSGGYPAFVFLLAYLLTAIFILYATGYYRQKDYRGLYRFAAYSALAVLLTALMASVVLISVYHLPGAMTRGEGVTLKQALFGAFTPRSMVSFFLPYASIREMDHFGTDMSMSNAYFGLVTLVFFITALFMRRGKIITLFLVWGLFCLVASAGDATPLRKWLYQFVPFMDQFRFPALFRIYVILSFVIVAGLGFERIVIQGLKLKVEDLWLKKRLMLSLTVVGLTLSIFMIIALAQGELKFREFIREDLFIFSEKSGINQHILFQGIIQLVFLGLFLLIMLMKNRMKHAMAGILVLLCLDMVLATRLNGPYTVYYHHYRSKDIHAHTAGFPEGFPMPGKGEILGNTDQGKLIYKALWRNLNIFQKQVSWQGYNPLHLRGFEELADNHTGLFEAILKNPLVYQSGRISPLDSLASHEANTDFDPGRIYFSSGDYEALMQENLQHSDRDSISIIHFSPVKIKATSTSRGNVLVNLLQNNYHGWKVTVDGNPAELMTGNMSFISVVVPAGQHEVEFCYNPRDVKVGFFITLLALVAGLVVMRGTLGGL